MPITYEGVMKEELIELGWTLLDKVSPFYRKETMFGKRDSDMRYFDMVSDGCAYYYLLEVQQSRIKITKTSTGGFTGNMNHEETLYFGNRPTSEQLKELENLLGIPKTSFSKEEEDEKYQKFWGNRKCN